jgi:hypothetical protein
MAVTKGQIESLFTRLPMVRPPANIYELANAEIGADRLYNATHRMNAAFRDQPESYHIYGMHQQGANFVTIAGDAPESTVLHESIHAMGIRSEQATYAITRGLMARARFNLGILRRPVRYADVPVSGSEYTAYMAAVGLSSAPGESRQATLVHLVYTP